VASDRFPRRHPDSAFRSIGDEGGMVVLPGRTEIKVLNPTGAKVFSLLDGSHSTDDIVREVVSEFDVSEDDARRDVNEFLSALEAHGMLAGTDQSPAGGGDG
jgi:hypothetical protein